MYDATMAGDVFRCLMVQDEATCFCLAIEVRRSLLHASAGAGCLETVGEPLWATPHCPEDNGPELQAQPLLTFFEDRGMIPSGITPGKPWQNGSNESLNGTFRRECLNAEVFHSAQTRGS